MNPTRSRDASVFVATVMCVAAAIAHVTSQAQGPPSATTFRSVVAYVEVDAAVTDAGGHFVPGLQASDFILLEDGQPRKISAFSFVDPGVPEGEGRHNSCA